MNHNVCMGTGKAVARWAVRLQELGNIRMASEPTKSQCSLLLLVATPAEEEALQEAATAHGIPFEKIKARDSALEEDFSWLGNVGNETVIAMRPARTNEHRLVMGSIGLLGTAARGIRLRRATGAQSIVQLGMAFGIDSSKQNAGDVLISTSIIPYDNRDVKPARRSWMHRQMCGDAYITDYHQAVREQARPALVELFRRESVRGVRRFNVYMGALLSGAARIHCHTFRDELVRGVPPGEDPIIGGEMEGVGLLAASIATDDPIWCIVKGISDFADEGRDSVIEANRPIACRNAAEFLLAALQNEVSN
ncbi:MAG: nucleoside phosphorylase-like protein [Pirellulales bacterium]